VPTARRAWRKADPEGVCDAFGMVIPRTVRCPIFPAPGGRTAFGGFACWRPVGSEAWNIVFMLPYSHLRPL
ncbi:MAG: hypothetical protein NZM16_09800, partial [Thermoflexus sp.]|uniref:hypothetical protein n=1 Tax=Thermoflexus sp. TaxID=1969742 RepID=UPI0025EEAF6A